MHPAYGSCGSSDETRSRGQTAVIVGAGLAGCLCGLVLARQGFHVRIYELRDDPRVQSARAHRSRSVNLALSTRGLTALRSFGLEALVVRSGVPMRSRCLHALDGNLSTMNYGGKGEYLMSVNRNALNRLLVEACEKEERIKLFFGWKCVEVDAKEVRIEFETQEKKKVVVHADFLVGADGTWSRVRLAMARACRLDFEQKYFGVSYKELSMPVSDRANGKSMPRECLHIWPRGRFMLIALPNPEGSFTCNLYMPTDEISDLDSGKESVLNFFRAQFNDAIEYLPALENEFHSNPTSDLVTIRCNPFHYGKRILLIGDAAHAIVPFYGQGCNAAFEDCRVLDDLFSCYGNDKMETVLSEFTHRRKENVDVIADLAIEHYNTMASKTASLIFKLKREAGLLLGRVMPSLFVPLYTMISFSNVPYAEAVRQSRRQEFYTFLVVYVAPAMLLHVAIIAYAYFY